jgi:putative flavoprotein involved in K+ transport
MIDSKFDAVVIGAGQAGLAAAYHLRESGLRYTLLESTDRAGGSWRNHYASLRLLSPARYASLPGLPFPGDPERYPSGMRLSTIWRDTPDLSIRR